MLKSNDEHIIEAIIESKVRNVFVGIGSLSKKSELSFFEEKLSEQKRRSKMKKIFIFNF